MIRIHSKPVREEIDHQMRQAIKAAEAELLPGFAVMLFALPFDNEDGRVFYISNANRKEMCDVLELWLKKQREREE